MNQTKTFTLTAARRKDSGDSETASAWISREEPDREGDVIVATGMDVSQWKRNPVVLWQHSRDRLPIGRGIDIRVEPGQGVTATWKWAGHPEAQTIKQLWSEGTLNATSVGVIVRNFEPISKGAVSGARYPVGMRITESELTEFSCVLVPAHPAALRRAKSLGLVIPGDADDEIVLQLSDGASSDAPVLWLDDAMPGRRSRRDDDRLILSEDDLEAIPDMVRDTFSNALRDVMEQAVGRMRGRIDSY